MGLGLLIMRRSSLGLMEIARAGGTWMNRLSDRLCQLVVTRFISARLVTPRRAFSRPEVRKVRMPSFWAMAAICRELAPCMINFAMFSDISMIS